jgi:hypothetical protein
MMVPKPEIKKLKTEFDLIHILQKNAFSFARVWRQSLQKVLQEDSKNLPLLLLIWVSKQAELDDVFEYVEKVEEKNRTKIYSCTMYSKYKSVGIMWVLTL